jgi:hypothetical protein
MRRVVSGRKINRPDPELSAHTVTEEEIFYPACRGKVEED